MARILSATLLLIILGLVWLEIPSIRAQFMSSPLMRRKQAVDSFIREIEALDLPVINQNELLSKKLRDGRMFKHPADSLQGRMVSEADPRDYSEVDINCDTELLDNLQGADLTGAQYSSRIECLNRNRHPSRLDLVPSNHNQNPILKMQTKLEKLIDYLNNLRVSQGRRSG